VRHTLVRLRVLVVLPFLPDREGRAAARCAVALLEGLRAHGVDCRVLALADAPAPASSEALVLAGSEAPVPASSDAPASRDAPVEVVSLELSRWQGRWRRLARPGSMPAGGRFAERLRRLVADVDVVHLVDVGMAGALSLLERPAVLQVDSLTQLDRRVVRLWAPEERDALQTLRAERRALRRADWLLLSSREVAAALPGRIPQARRAIAPLALDPVLYERQASLERPIAGLIGTARWPPTANAVRRLLGRVWPLVLERRPDARLMLAGVGMEASEFADGAELPGVQWRGRVPSASDFLRELGVLLYPLTRGSGVKVKVLEALALGVPVVSTRDGAEGLRDRGGVVVEQNDEELAAATVALLDDEAARHRAGARARENFLANHTPAVATLPVLELYERMIRHSRV
jgi:glycosyltransferase involved in cell wall biosynthesis